MAKVCVEKKASISIQFPFPYASNPYTSPFCSINSGQPARLCFFNGQRAESVNSLVADEGEAVLLFLELVVVAGLVLGGDEVVAVVAVLGLVELDGGAEQDVGDITDLDIGLKSQESGLGVADGKAVVDVPGVALVSVVAVVRLEALLAERLVVREEAAVRALVVILVIIVAVVSVTIVAVVAVATVGARTGQEVEVDGGLILILVTADVDVEEALVLALVVLGQDIGEALVAAAAPVAAAEDTTEALEALVLATKVQKGTLAAEVEETLLVQEVEVKEAVLTSNLEVEDTVIITDTKRQKRVHFDVTVVHVELVILVHLAHGLEVLLELLLGQETQDNQELEVEGSVVLLADLVGDLVARLVAAALVLLVVLLLSVLLVLGKASEGQSSREWG